MIMIINNNNNKTVLEERCNLLLLNLSHLYGIKHESGHFNATGQRVPTEQPVLT